MPVFHVKGYETVYTLLMMTLIKKVMKSEEEHGNLLTRTSNLMKLLQNLQLIGILNESLSFLNQRSGTTTNENHRQTVPLPILKDI